MTQTELLTKKETVENKENNEEKKERKDGEKGNTFQRIKIRLSKRSKKADSEILEQKHYISNGSNKDVKAKQVEVKEDNCNEVTNSENIDKGEGRQKTIKEKKTLEEVSTKKEEKSVIKEKKNKDENIIVRMIRKLSFRKKKGKKKIPESETKSETNFENKCDLSINCDKSKEENNDNKVEIKDTDDVKRKENLETLPPRPHSMIIEGRPLSSAGGRPPLPRGRNPPTPSSASTQHTRPISQLDEALKQFRLSTAASRESLRNMGSNQDINKIDDESRAAVSRSVSRQGSLRRGGTLPRNLPRTVMVAISLSASMEELRKNQQTESQ